METDQRNEVRAAIFLSGADEIAKIDDPAYTKIVLGRITVCAESIRRVIGKSPAELRSRDGRTLEMLRIAASEGLNIRIRNDDHLFQVLNKMADDMIKPCGVKKTDRVKGAAVFRKIHAKLSNGFAGCDI